MNSDYYTEVTVSFVMHLPFVRYQKKMLRCSMPLMGKKKKNREKSYLRVIFLRTQGKVCEVDQLPITHI